MQLDIFEHSRNVMLRNAAADALRQSDLAAARAALEQLRNDYPEDVLLADLETLTAAYSRRTQQLLRGHDDVPPAVIELEQRIVPAARNIYSRDAPRLLRPLWRDLAEQARALAFRRDRPDAHAVPLWLQAGEWQIAADSIERLEAWRRIPVTLGWMIEARYRLQGLDAIWPWLAELAWLAPARLEQVIRVLDDALLTSLTQRFVTEFDADAAAADLAWLPAWLLVHRPALQRLLATAAPGNDNPPERALRTMVGLLVLERAGRHRELVHARAELRALHAGLFADYMRTR